LQPTDVGINRVFKHKVKQSALDFFTSYVARKLGEGIPPEKIVIPMDLPTLRDASIAWTLDAWLYFCEHPDIVRRAWENCKVDGLNLSWESLQSPEATRNLEDLLANDEIFRRRIGSNPELPHSSDPTVRDAESRGTFDDNEDDSSATVDDVIAASNEPAGESIEIAAEDFSYVQVPDEDEEGDGNVVAGASGDNENSDDGGNGGAELVDSGTDIVPRHDDDDELEYGEEFNTDGEYRVDDYDRLDTTPPASATSISDKESDDLHDSENMLLGDLNDSASDSAPAPDSASTDRIPHDSPQPQPFPLSPEIRTLHHFALDIATLGGTNPAALASPVKPSKSRKESGKPTATKSRPRNDKNDVVVSTLTRSVPAATTTTAPVVSEMSRPKRKIKPPPRYGEEGSDGSGIEAEPSSKKRKGKKSLTA
jgi:hypothetical protein